MWVFAMDGKKKMDMAQFFSVDKLHFRKKKPCSRKANATKEAGATGG